MKIDRSILFAPLLLCLPAANVYGQTAAAPLNSSELTALVETMRPPETDDPFTEIPNQSAAVGKTFRLSLSVPRGDVPGNSDGNAVYWTYDPATQSLKLVAALNSFDRLSFIVSDKDLYDSIESIAGYYASYKGVVSSLGPRSNAYGTTVNVSFEQITGAGVASFTPDGAPHPPYSSYETSLTLPPEDGRRLSKDVRLIVEGRIVKFLNRGIICGSDYFKATIRNPRSTSVKWCVLPSEFTRIAFVDSANGKVIKEWANPR